METSEKNNLVEIIYIAYQHYFQPRTYFFYYLFVNLPIIGNIDMHDNGKYYLKRGIIYILN